MRKICAIGAVVIMWFMIADLSPMLMPYSARQLPGQVPYGHFTKFWVYKPLGYSPDAPAYPLLISLHGGSAIGDDLEMLFEHTHENPPQLIHVNEWFDLPFVVVSPQLRRDPAHQHYNEQMWPESVVDEVLEFVKKEYNIDPARVYVTGISLGAAGAWCYAIAHPEKVSAIVPLGGQSFKENACSLKDVGVWAFHGENDVFVPTAFTPRMIEAINECEPQGRYKAHANVAFSMQHEVWDQVFNMTGGYNVYDWMLRFKKNDSANLAPVAAAGVDRKIKIPEDHFYLTGESFDSDGHVDTTYWSQVGGPVKAVMTREGKNVIKVSAASRTGVYTFRFTARDNRGGTSSDEVSVTLLEENESHAALSLTLTDQTGTRDLGKLYNGMMIDLAELGGVINIKANIQGFNYSVRWSVNNDNNTRETPQWHVRFWKDYSPKFLRATDDGPLKSGWRAQPGDYLVCATVIDNGFFRDSEVGTSLCYKITLK